MTTSSPEPRVVGAAPADATAVRAVPLSGRELRTGGWTRLGSSAVLGDPVTERTLSGLVDRTQAAARSQGYAVGWAEGRRAAEARAAETERQHAERRRAEDRRREAEHRDALDSLARATSAVQDAFAAACARVESSVTDAAFLLTEALVGHELSVAASPGADAVARALALVPGEAVVRIRVTPGEAGLPELAAVAGTATVVADPTLGLGDVVVETADGVVDARVSTALDRVRQALSS